MPGIGQCAICFSTLISSEIYVVIKCGHTFHKDCILQWIKHGKNCSSCRVKASATDVIKLYIQETSLDDTFATQNNPEAKILEIEAKLEKVSRKYKKLGEEKEKTEDDNRTLNRKIKKLQSDVDSIPALRLRLEQMDDLANNYAATQRELAEVKKKLNVSEFYDMLTKKGKDAGEYKKYINSNGTINELQFLSVLSKERDSLKKRLDQANADLKAMEKELNQERKKCLERKEACNKMQRDLKKMNERLENKRDGSPLNPKLKDIINYSSPVQKNPRQSLGFRFESPPVSVKVLDSAINDKRVKKRIVIDDEEENDMPSTSRPKPSPPKKQKGFSFEIDSDSDWQPSPIQSSSAMTIPSPVSKFTRKASSTKNLGTKKFGTTIKDSRPLITKPVKPSAQQVKTRSMDKYVEKNVIPAALLDDSVICIDDEL